MTLNLKDKVVIVVGAAGTIGSAVAKEFAKEGAKVVAADIRAAELNEVAEAIKAEGAAEKAMAEDLLSKYEVQLGLKSPETSAISDTAKTLGPVTEK